MPPGSMSPQVKAAKRKRIRGVSTMTPGQLARKRANDRESQRAIRARTRAHILHLEQELQELRKSQQHNSQGESIDIEILAWRNSALENELGRLREKASATSFGSRLIARSCPQEGILHNITGTPSTCFSDCGDSLSIQDGSLSSESMSPLSGHYSTLSDFGVDCDRLPSDCETWTSTLPEPTVPILTGDFSSFANGNYSSTYNPSSAPNSMPLPSNSLGGTAESDGARSTDPHTSAETHTLTMSSRVFASDTGWISAEHYGLSQPTDSLQDPGATERFYPLTSQGAKDL